MFGLELEHLIVFALLFVIFGIPTAFLAKRKNRNFWVWLAVGFFFSGAALVTLAFLDYVCPNCHAPLTNQEAKQGKCPRCNWAKTAEVKNK